MPSPFSQGVQNADKAFGGLNFSAGIAGTGTLTTTDAAIGIAHGLGATPNFVLAFSSLAVAAGAAAGKFGYTADATTITFTKADTGAIETFSYIAAVIP